MESKKIRSHQSVKTINHDTTLPNSDNEPVTHLPELSKKPSLTSNLNVKKSLSNEVYDKIKVSKPILKSNLLLNNKIIEQSKTKDGIKNIKKKSLKNESIIDLIDNTNSFSKEDININSHTKSNMREKKIIPQWENLVNDVTDNLIMQDKLRTSRKTIPPIDHKIVQSSQSKSYSEVRRKKNSSFEINKTKSRNLSLHKLNKSESGTIEKNKKTESKKSSTNNSNISIVHNNSKMKEKLKKKKSNMNSINKSHSSFKRKSNSKSISNFESIDKTKFSVKNIKNDSSCSKNDVNDLFSNKNTEITNDNINYHLFNSSSHSSFSNLKINQNILSSNKSLTNSFVSILSEDKNQAMVSYPITSYQLGLFNCIDSVDTPKRKRNSHYYTIQCYQIDKSLDPNIMNCAVNKICDKYAVLKTRFYQNNKIIDANVEAIIDEETYYNKLKGNYKNIIDYQTKFSYFEEVKQQNYPKLVTLSETSVHQFLENWINTNPVFENQFKVFMFQYGIDKDWVSFSKNDIKLDNTTNIESTSSIEEIPLVYDDQYINMDNEDERPRTLIAIIGSIMVADEISLNAIMNEIITLYSLQEEKRDSKFHIRIIGDEDNDDSEISDPLESFKSKEDNYCYIDFAQEQKENINKMKVSIDKIKSFWKNQCTEVNNDILLPNEKEEMIEKLKKNKKDLVEKKEKYSQLEKRKKEYEVLIEKLTNDRIQLEKGNGSVATVIDPINGERLEISNEAKQVILKMISGSETTSTIEPFLIKHEVSDHVRKRIRSSTMKIEDFASLSDKDLETYQLNTSERRKIAALVEYVRNRIRECIQGHSKVKISLERHLSKAQRELDRCIKDYKKYEKSIEKLCNEILKINSILHPSLKISHIPVMQLQGIRQKSVDRNDWGEYNLHYSFMPLHLESDQNQYFQTFFDDWKNKYYKEYRVERCLMKKMEREKRELVNLSDIPLVEPDYDYLSDDDNYYGSENSFYNNMPSTEAICLAIYGVLLRHISGIEKFLIGVHQSQRRIYRECGCIIGPLSNIIPIKVDLSQKGITFYNLFANLIFSIKKSRKVNCDYSYTQLFNFPDLPQELPVQYEFISKEESTLWRKMGLELKDIFLGLSRNSGWTKDDIDFSSSSLSNNNNSENIDSENMKYRPNIKQLWSSNFSNTFIFKLIIVEWDDDTIKGGIIYSKNHFDEDQVSKWVGKFETLIENIELGKPKVTVANLISRLYQNLRWKGSQMLLSSSMQI
ncbi:hypothetical protein BCR36DRAFT_402649 [Piromyces finnis]|uniref:Condensation domain-containing protein n=1 Tax=Piromyces finnis TaxID=1754191 RepID=A0A1Y1VI24_9FUNG|nr:hypothetical protein BCR36DRAFT_402649 [Piromyces finnis]|eukprot:ORX56679.1 hypothetical protein BCR36DRAFT_402649 [Piromyces finnis]